MKGKYDFRSRLHLAARREVRPGLALRATAFLLCCLTVLGASVSPAGAASEGSDVITHVGVLCLVALSAALAKVHVLFIWLLALGAASALAERGFRYMQLRALLGSLEAREVAPGSSWARLAAAAGLDSARLRVSDALPAPAFTVGLLQPVVYVHSVLEYVLERDELIAVLAHERAHVLNHDPLRFMLLRLCSRAFFWLPALSRLERDITEGAELRADYGAMSAVGLPVASALIKVARRYAPIGPELAHAGFVDHSDMIARRVRILLGQEAPLRSHLGLRAAATSAALLFVLSISTVAAVSEASGWLRVGEGNACAGHQQNPLRHVISHPRG